MKIKLTPFYFSHPYLVPLFLLSCSYLEFRCTALSMNRCERPCFSKTPHLEKIGDDIPGYEENRKADLCTYIPICEYKTVPSWTLVGMTGCRPSQEGETSSQSRGSSGLRGSKLGPMSSTTSAIRCPLPRAKTGTYGRSSFWALSLRVRLSRTLRHR